MKKNFTWWAGLLSLAAGPPAQAQPVTTTANTSATANVYAQQAIDLLPGFEANYDGFEARIMLPQTLGGWWSAPLRWTPHQRYQNTLPQDIPAGFTQNSVTGLIGIHTHVTPDGNVLTWEGHNENTMADPTKHASHAFTWNPSPNAQQGGNVYPNVYNEYENPNSNIFCSGHSFLKDGRLLVAGGHYSLGDAADLATFPSDILRITSNPGSGYIGLNDVNTFNYMGDPSSSQSGYVWQSSSGGPTLPAMSSRRWYPTNTTLADGRVLVTSGQAYASAAGASVQGPPEVYNPTTNSWQVLGNAARLLPLYPWMFQAPDGRVFNAGPNPDAKFLNPTAAAIGSTAAGTWDATTYPTLLGRTREYGSAVMYAPGKILILGGNTYDYGVDVTNTAEHIDLNEPTPQFRPAAAMQFRRTHVNATLLADGTVLATGGTATRSNSDTEAVLPAELWTPPASATAPGTWTTMNALAVPRLYHSTAVLLPDATVLTTGGGQGANYADHPDYQIFTPPYLCKGLARPVIGSAPQAIAYGQSFTVSSPQASSIVNGGRATLVRLSSVTHAFNMNQRFLELTPTAGSTAGTLRLTAPANANVCPPGHYMLFLLNSNGVPSLASIVVVDAAACPHLLSMTQTTLTQTPCDKVTRFVVNGGVSVYPYVWTVNGVVDTGNTGPALDLPTSTDAPTVQVQVYQDAGCGISSTLTSYFPHCDQPSCRNCLPQMSAK